MEVNNKKNETKILDDKLANLKKVSELENKIYEEFGELQISTVNEEHIPELAELWANHATIQQIFAPERYNFKFEGKDWRAFVRRKLEKSNNLLLVATTKDSKEVKGFLYLQTVTLPSSELILKAFIEDIYTKPQHRRKGIASKLLSVAINWANRHGINNIELITLVTSKDVSNFYQSFLKSSRDKNINLELMSIN